MLGDFWEILRKSWGFELISSCSLIKEINAYMNMVIGISSWGGYQWTLSRIRIFLPIRLQQFWYRWKEEVHAVILSYSTSKSIDGARRYPHFMLKALRFLTDLYRVSLCSLPSPSWRDFNNHVHITVYFFNQSGVVVWVWRNERHQEGTISVFRCMPDTCIIVRIQTQVIYLAQNDINTCYVAEVTKYCMLAHEFTAAISSYSSTG